MKTFTRNEQLPLKELGEKLRRWFDQKDWQVQACASNTYYNIKAKKENWWRVALAACRALIVNCRHEGNKTIVEVSQGSWATNLGSNVVCLAMTGGTNLAFTGWSLVVQKQYESYVEEVLRSF